MSNYLKDYIYARADVPQEEWDFFLTLLKTRELKKGEIFFNQNEVVDVIAFVIHGLFMNYYLDYKNEKKIKKFAYAGKIVSPISSLLDGRIGSRFTSQVLEDSKILFIKYDDLLGLYGRHPAWSELGRKLAEEALLEKEKREYETLCLSLNEQYDSFVENNRDIVNRVPQYLIAAYMGINAVSLSRLKGQRLKRERGTL